MPTVVVVHLSLGQNGVTNLSLSEILLGVLDLVVALLNELLQRLLNIHEFKLFLNL